MYWWASALVKLNGEDAIRQFRQVRALAKQVTTLRPVGELPAVIRSLWVEIIRVTRGRVLSPLI